MKKLLLAITTGLLLSACSESMTAEQQEVWDLIEDRIEEGYETWDDLWHWADEMEIPWGVRVEDERPINELIDQIFEFGLVGNYIESEPAFGLEELGNDDKVTLLAHFESLNYNEDVQELLEFDMTSEESLDIFLAAGGLGRLEENFASVIVDDILEETEESFENDGSIDVEFLRWEVENSGFVSFENSYISITRLYEIVELYTEEIQAMVIEMLNEMDAEVYIDFGYHTPSAGHSGNVNTINQSGLANVLDVERDFIFPDGNFSVSNIDRVNQDGEDVDPSSDEVNESNFVEWSFDYEVDDDGRMTITFTVVYDIEDEEEHEEDDEDEDEEDEDDTEEDEEDSEEEEVTTEFRNALASGRNYLRIMNFSYTSLTGQLEFERFSPEAIAWAMEQIDAETDWYEHAVGSAENYLDIMSFSPAGLIDQLVFEGYTRSQAEHAVEIVFD